MVISSHTCDETAEQATLKDENSNTLTLRMYDRHKTGSVQGYVIAASSAQTAETLESARAALIVGAVFTPPSNKLFSAEQDAEGNYVDGVPIITEVSYNTSNSEFATMTISYVQYPLIQGTIDDATLAN